MADTNINITRRDIIGVQLEQLIKSQDTLILRLGGVDERLLNPETGLFSKVRDIDNSIEELTNIAEDAKSDIDKLVDICNRHESRVANMERWAESHEERDNELRDNVIKITSSLQPLMIDFDARGVRKKWTDKMMWLVIAAVITGMLPTLKFMLFDASSEKQRVDALEALIREDRESRNEENKTKNEQRHRDPSTIQDEPQQQN